MEETLTLVVQPVVTDIRAKIASGDLAEEAADVINYLQTEWYPKFPEVAELIAPMGIPDLQAKIIEELTKPVEDEDDGADED
jgi:hypothetical protein